MANITIFPEQTITGFAYNEEYGAYSATSTGAYAPFTVVAGETYSVYWDGSIYECIAQDASAMAAGVIALGDASYFGGAGNDEPFLIGWSQYGVSYFAFDDKTEHTIAIYEGVIEPEVQPEIVLKGYSDTEFKFPSETVEKVALNNTDGEEVIFSKGEVIEEPLQINLDFTNGNQTVEAPEGYLVKQATIVKPEDAIPENILKDKNIGGIIGTAELGGGTPDIPADEQKYFAYQFANGRIEICGISYNRINAATGSCNVTIPDTIGGFPVSLNPLFDVVTHSGKKGLFMNSDMRSTTIGENVKFVNNSMDSCFYGCPNFNSPVTIPVGVTTVRNAFSECANFNSPVTIPAGVTNMWQMFNGCYNFNQPVTIPEGVTTTAYMFAYCRNFNQPVTIPESVTSASSMFNGCTNFNQPVVISNGVLYLEHTFNSCSKFNQPVTIPESVRSMWSTFGNSANFNSPVTISNGVTNMLATFFNCANFNQPVTIPESVTSVVNAFNRCTNFNSPVTISNGVTNMFGMFGNCRSFNQPVTIPESVTNVVNAFGYCNNMAQDITILATNINNAAYMLYGKNNSLRINIFVPAGSQTNGAVFNGNVKYMLSGSFSWTRDTANNSYYNTRYNVYVYYV